MASSGRCCLRRLKTASIRFRSSRLVHSLSVTNNRVMSEECCRLTHDNTVRTINLNGQLRCINTQTTDQQYRALHELQQPRLNEGVKSYSNNETTEKPIHFEDLLFRILCDKNEKLSVSRFKTALKSTGLREDDPRLKETINHFNHLQAKVSEFDGMEGIYIDQETFTECVTDNIVLLAKAFQNRMIIPEFSAFSKRIEKLYWKAKSNTDGKVATYIPQLSRFSPDLWGVSVCTVDGQRFSLGDVNMPFCLQSMSKPLSYALVLDDLGPDVVHQYVGHEPSGTAFNEISLNYQKRPHNPMINSGAIVVCGLMAKELSIADRFDRVAREFKRLAGGEFVGFSNATFLSERESADRNYALGYYLRENQCFPQGTNLMETMDFYFQLCSVEVTCESASIMAATLANGGICPITEERVLNSVAVRDTLSLMHSCGMYDYSGQFAFRVGLPAKSGVSGGILLVVPNVMGICLWSPPLDNWGNSCRGRQFSEDLVSLFNFHNYDNIKHTAKKLDPRRRRNESKAQDIVNLLFGAYNGDVTALTRYSLVGMDMSQADYDGRTALHLAAAEGHLPVVNFLINKCKVSPFLKDRWGFTPLDDAERFKHEEVQEVLQAYMDTLENVTVEEDTLSGHHGNQKSVFVHDQIANEDSADIDNSDSNRSDDQQSGHGKS